MPLEIDYRPFTLPPGTIPPAAVVACTGAGDVADDVTDAGLPGAGIPEYARPRDFAARLRQRDARSIRKALRHPSIVRKRVGGIVAVGALGVALGSIGWASPGGIEPATARMESGPGLPFEQQGYSFPGSAFYYVSASDNGLISPDAAEQAWAAHRDDEQAASPLSPAGPAARPVFARGSFEDQARAQQCLTAAIYYEAASEPDSGQRAVAQVVLNRVVHPAFPKTVCGVVYQGSERPGCQFSFACDGSLARRPVAAFWERARRVARDALSGYVYAPVGLATHYHTTAVHPYWADSLAFIGVLGAHRFYRWSGAAGRPVAFNAVYAGGEPIAAPHPRTWVPTPADIADPVALARAYEEGRLAALNQQQGGVYQAGLHPAGAAPAFGQAPLPHAGAPAYAPMIEQSGGDTALRAGNLPGSGRVRPEYENSGKWIATPGS